MKKLIWTALLAASSATAASLSFKLVHLLWVKIGREEPPKPPRWARFLIGKPVTKGIAGGLHLPIWART